MPGVAGTLGLSLQTAIGPSRTTTLWTEYRITIDYQGLSALPLSIDAIQEFKVTSGVAPAEYGYAGTQVSVATRSGTNTFHGRPFEYYRSTQMQARDPFSNTSALPSFVRNQFGDQSAVP
ncbi:MAG: hypothetical protein ACJ746_03545 [Bryobacteraceae bacterium]